MGKAVFIRIVVHDYFLAEHSHRIVVRVRQVDNQIVVFVRVVAPHGDGVASPFFADGQSGSPVVVDAVCQLLVNAASGVSVPEAVCGK